MSSNYQENYIDYDDFGLLNIRCIRCGNIVLKRVEVESKKFSGKLVFAYRRLPNWFQERFYLNDGSYIEPIFCRDCSNINKENDKELVMKAIANEWVISVKKSGGSKEKLFMEEAKAAILKIHGKHKPDESVVLETKNKLKNKLKDK